MAIESTKTETLKEKPEGMSEVIERAAEVGQERLRKLAVLLAPDVLIKGGKDLIAKAIQRKKEGIADKVNDFIETTQERTKNTKEKWWGRIRRAFERLGKRGEEIKGWAGEKIKSLGERAVGLGIKTEEFVGRRVLNAIAAFEEWRAKRAEMKAEKLERVLGEAKDNSERFKEKANETREKANNFRGPIRRIIERMPTIQQ
jgi:hypothetical protein